MTRTRKLLTAAALLACLAAWLGVRVWRHNSQASESIVIIDPAASATAPAEKPPTDWVDLAPRPMPRIKPGTEITAQPPAGWSHLVLHGVPRVAEGDVDRVSPLVVRLASLLHLTILADVQADDTAQPPRFSLREVAIGLSLDINGHDWIISTDTQKSLGADLGLIDRSTLAENEAFLVGVRQVARTSTMLVFDAPAVMRLDEQNRNVLQRHALLVSPRTGKLATLVWILEADGPGTYRLPASEMQWLPPGLEDDRMLFVDAAQFTLGIPSKEAFALVRLPQGKKIDIAPEIAPLACSRFPSPDAVHALERALRAAIGWQVEKE